MIWESATSLLAGVKLQYKALYVGVIWLLFLFRHLCIIGVWLREYQRQKP